MSEPYIVQVFDAATGAEEIREATEAEAAWLDEVIGEMDAAQTAVVEAQEAAAVARAAAIEHAESLGFTPDMIAVMFPGLAG